MAPALQSLHFLLRSPYYRDYVLKLGWGARVCTVVMLAMEVRDSAATVAYRSNSPREISHSLCRARSKFGGEISLRRRGRPRRNPRRMGIPGRGKRNHRPCTAWVPANPRAENDVALGLGLGQVLEKHSSTPTLSHPSPRGRLRAIDRRVANGCVHGSVAAGCAGGHTVAGGWSFTAFRLG